MKTYYTSENLPQNRLIPGLCLQSQKHLQSYKLGNIKVSWTNRAATTSVTIQSIVHWWLHTSMTFSFSFGISPLIRMSAPIQLWLKIMLLGIYF